MEYPATLQEAVEAQALERPQDRVAPGVALMADTMTALLTPEAVEAVEAVATTVVMGVLA